MQTFSNKELDEYNSLQEFKRQAAIRRASQQKDQFPSFHEFNLNVTRMPNDQNGNDTPEVVTGPIKSFSVELAEFQGLLKDVEFYVGVHDKQPFSTYRIMRLGDVMTAGPEEVFEKLIIYNRLQSGLVRLNLSDKEILPNKRVKIAGIVDVSQVSCEVLEDDEKINVPAATPTPVLASWINNGDKREASVQNKTGATLYYSSHPEVSTDSEELPNGATLLVDDLFPLYVYSVLGGIVKTQDQRRV